jgi:cell division protease FtsH
VSAWHRPTPPADPAGGAPRSQPPPPPPRWRIWLLPAGLLFTVLLFFRSSVSGKTPAKLTYTTFVGDVTANRVATATINSSGTVSGTLHGGSTFTSQVPTALNDTTLSPLLIAHHVQVMRVRPRC